jgi:small subunit ribosomal protein S1
MVNRNLIRSLENDAEFHALIQREVGGVDEPNLASLEGEAGFDTNRIVEGRIIRVDEDQVLVDVGFKSEGTISRSEWDEHEPPPQVGDSVKVLVEELEDEQAVTDEFQGMIALSKRKAQKILDWQRMMETVKEGEVVTGTVTRKIKGGLLVDIGVNVFLPASQVDIRRPNDIGDYIGKVAA